jgi:MFS family permease
MRYAWLLVVAATLMMAVTYGLMYTYSVFFKPLADYFQWDRASVSLIYSASLVIRGGISIATGWLADKYGARKLMLFCGVMIGLGLILSSFVTSFWQFFITYSLIESIGLSGTFGIVTAVVSRWFTKNRGLALGIVSSGVGLGTLLMVPGAERLIAATDWSQAFLIFGILSGLVVIVCSLFLKSPPADTVSAEVCESKPATAPAVSVGPAAKPADLSLKQAIVHPRMIMGLIVFTFLFFANQMVMVHLVNYATDLGISPLAAAGLISLIGVISIGGRLIMGVGSDRIGMHNILILVCGLVAGSLVCLVFTRQLWAFYLCAVFFGFAYGGEVPQIPLFVNQIGGMRTMATLVGLTLFMGNVGGALGPWVAGKIFDVTGSYQWAYTCGAIVATLALLMAIFLKYQNKKHPA